MILKFGLFKLEKGWKRILEQEGLSWKICSLKELNPNKITLFILNKEDFNKKEVLNYIKKGGLIITNIKIHSLIDNKIKYKIKYLKEIKGKHKVFNNVEILNIHKKSYISKNSNINNCISKKYGDGYIFSIPFDLNEIILDRGTINKYFDGGILPVDEKVSLINKGEVRKFITNIFKYLFELKKIPYIHKWYYPKDYKTVFTFRIDLDEYYKPHSIKVLEIAKKYDISITWFINFENLKVNKFLNKLKENKQDIQSHSYKHESYNSFKKDYENILKAHKTLRIKGINPSGFSTPFGRWNDEIGHSLELLNYNYSSDFSLNYEDLPFHPIIKNKEANLLQIPIHPICEGRFLIRFYSIKNIKKYFYKIIKRFYLRDELIFLYGHPTNKLGKYPEILSFIFKTIKSLDNILITNLTDYSKFWRKREKVKFDINYEKNIKIITKNNDKELFFRVILPNGKYRLFPLIKKEYLLNKEFNPIKVINKFKKKRVKIYISKLLFYIYWAKQTGNSIKNKLFFRKLF